MKHGQPLQNVSSHPGRIARWLGLLAFLAAILAIFAPEAQASALSQTSGPTSTTQVTACAASITGTVFDDANHNRQLDAGEAGIPGAALELSSADKSTYSTVSAADGTYAFSYLAPGAYSLKETPAPGFAHTGEEIVYLTVSCGSPTVQNWDNYASSATAVPGTTSVAATTPPAAAAAAPADTPASTPALAPLTADSPALSWIVTNQPVTTVYVNDAGDIYYGDAQTIDGVGNPFLGNSALWKKPVNADPIQLTPYSHNLIGGIAVYHGNIYFNEAGTLDQIPDDNQLHQQVEILLRFSTLSKIYGHLNSALAVTTFQGEPILLISVGSQIDSNYDAPDHPSGIQPPYYEPFPTGRIIFAKFPWLETARNYDPALSTGGEVYEYARGVRNPWGMTVATLGGQTHVYAIDNDPAFRPEKNDSDPQNAGDELNDIVFGVDYGHPYYYGGEEPSPYGKPLSVFLDGTVPSGVAVADGRLFVSLYQGAMIVQVDPTNPDIKHNWTPVLKGLSPFSLFAQGDLLYLPMWNGLQVINVKDLPTGAAVSN